MSWLFWIPILFAFAGILLLGAFIGDSLPWYGKRAGRIASVLVLLFGALLLYSIFFSNPGWLTPLGYYGFTGALAWRGRIWWQDRELTRRRSLRVARRRARLHR